MIRASARIVLFIFTLSIVLFPLLEAGHDVLHHFENEFHHHTASHHHTLKDHHVHDHHDLDEQEEESTAGAYFSFLFAFFFRQYKTPVTRSNIPLSYNDVFNCVYNSITQCPPTPPPWHS